MKSFNCKLSVVHSHSLPSMVWTKIFQKPGDVLTLCTDIHGPQRVKPTDFAIFELFL